MTVLRMAYFEWDINSNDMDFYTNLCSMIMSGVVVPVRNNDKVVGKVINSAVITNPANTEQRKIRLHIVADAPSRSRLTCRPAFVKLPDFMKKVCLVSHIEVSIS